MKVLLLLAAMILTFGTIQIQGSLREFFGMVEHVTARSATEYSNYGCHCGHDGRGTPKDETDWCCFEHHCCYHNLQLHGCNKTYLHYTFTFEENSIVCDDFQEPCAKHLCKCDRTAAKCFANNTKTYSPEYHGYNNTFCQGNSPKC